MEKDDAITRDGVPSHNGGRPKNMHNWQWKNLDYIICDNDVAPLVSNVALQGDVP